MTHLWDLMTSASVTGNALVQPMSDAGDMPLSHLLGRAERTASDVLGALHGRVPRRLGILMDNGEPWLRGALAAAYLDAAFVPLPKAVGFAGADAYIGHLRRIVLNAGLAGVLVDATVSRAMSRRLTSGLDPVPLIDVTEPVSPRGPACGPDRDDDALAVIQYTSGSTSRPKGVTLTHRNVTAGLTAITGGLGWTGDDAFGIWLPLFHDMGLFATLSSLAAGSPVCLWRPADFVRRPLEWLASFAESPATVMPAPNFCYDLLVSAARQDGLPPGLDLSGWRIACNGAEQVQRRTLETFAEVFGPCGLTATALTPVYGMAEATLTATVPQPGTTWRSVTVDRDRLRLGDSILPCHQDADGARCIVACGRAVPGIQLRVGGTDGTVFADGLVGEVQITGPAVTEGYLGLPEAEQPFTPDHWLRTGDLAFRLDGDVYVTGRLKDMITVRGQNFYAEDVEEIVRSTPGIGRCRNAAIAWDDDGDERMVVLWETPLEEDQAGRMARAACGRVKRLLGLDAVEVIPVPPATIPHTTSGKVQRRATGQFARDSYIAGGQLRGKPVTAQPVTKGESR